MLTGCLPSASLLLASYGIGRYMRVLRALRELIPRLLVRPSLWHTDEIRQRGAVEVRQREAANEDPVQNPLSGEITFARHSHCDSRIKQQNSCHRANPRQSPVSRDMHDAFRRKVHWLWNNIVAN